MNLINIDSIDFLDSNINRLLDLNVKYGWSLNKDELLMIKKYFKKLKRNPTRCEIETIAQSWSEHCKHKTFNGPVDLIWKDSKGKIIGRKKFRNLFKETIVYATKKLNKQYCLSVFKDNAGVIELDNKWGVCFKVETHNHPSAIEPYGGAETGVGGVVRDVLGVGLGAKPLLNTDVFCFAYPDRKYKIEKGFLSPHKIINGVVSGVRDYGNKIGVPTSAGAVFFDDDFLYNPLVYVGCVGIIPRDKIYKKVIPGSLIFVIGGSTGRDGIGGSTFSSSDITKDTSLSHIQIGHPINEKKIIDVIMKARDLGLYTAITDCGAGGFSSAVGELASECGAEVFLENVILKDKNIESWEIWLSESQERMVLCVPEDKVQKLIDICELEECQYYIIGRFTDDKKLRVLHNDKSVVDIDMEFLHQGLPKIVKKAEYIERRMKNDITVLNSNEISERFKRVISDVNVCSRRCIIEQYDCEVMGHTIVKPFCSTYGLSPTDGCVIWPFNIIGGLNKYSGFAVSQAINPFISKISPYYMSYYVVDEAIRNLVCIGADIEHGAILDNYCVANPNNPKIMGDFTISTISLRQASLEMKLPFISGKDSFYNQTVIGNKVYSIPLTLLVSAIAPVKDVRKVITSCFKKPSNPIYVIGRFLKGLGGSVYASIYEKNNNFISPLDLKENRSIYLKILDMIERKIIVCAHDVSEGGFISNVFEMTGEFSAELDISDIVKRYKVSLIEALFGECGSKIIVEVDKEKEDEFLKNFSKVPIVKVGEVCNSLKYIIKNNGFVIINEDVNDIRKIFERNFL